MKYIDTITNNKKARFALVGVINTVLDFGVFTALVAGGLKPVIANYLSTTLALSFSFVANRKYTFRATGPVRKKEIASFLGFTLFGLWVIQPVTISWVGAWILGGLHNKVVSYLGAKLIATGLSLLWNYITYSRFVFKDGDNASIVEG